MRFSSFTSPVRGALCIFERLALMAFFARDIISAFVLGLANELMEISNARPMNNVVL
jgi:hypothetical protein